jgi:hypothetical protein
VIPFLSIVALAHNGRLGGERSGKSHVYAEPVRAEHGVLVAPLSEDLEQVVGVLVVPVCRPDDGLDIVAVLEMGNDLIEVERIQRVP